MQHSKLLRLLSIFSAEDLQRFKVFVESPYFNTNRNVTALFYYIFPFAPQFDNQNLTPESAYGAIFPNDKGRADKKDVIIKLSSKLLALAERFLEHQALQSEPFIGALFRKRWFRQHQHSEWEALALDDMIDANQRQSLHDESFSQQRYTIEYERVKWELAAHLIAEKIDLRKLNFTLDEYYLRAKLECLCHITNHFLVSNRDYEIPEMALVERMLNMREAELMPTTRLWFAALRLLRQPTDQALFQQLKTALQAQEAVLPALEKQTFFVFLTNAARLTFPSPNSYFTELFALYQFQLAAGTLLSNGVIAPEAFFNVLSVALRQKEHDWAFQFVQTYREHLDPSSDKRDDMLALCNSMVAMARGRYDEALDFLNTTHFKDVQSKLAERRLRLKIYLELGYEDLFLDQTNSFRKFLSVNKSLVPPHHAEANRNFIQAVLSVYRLISSPAEQAPPLLDFIASTALLPEKNWLEEKIREYLQGR